MTELSPTARRGGVRAVLPEGSQRHLAPDESSVILLNPPPPLAGVSTAMKRERQQNDRTLVNGFKGTSLMPDKPYTARDDVSSAFPSFAAPKAGGPALGNGGSTIDTQLQR